MVKIGDLKNNRKVEEILKRYGVKIMAIFGSVAKNTDTEDSDLDLIVEFEKGRKNLFKMIELSQKLSDLLGVKVDLLTKDSISRYLRDKIDKEKIVIYEKTE